MNGDDEFTGSAMIDDPMSNGGESTSPPTAAMGEPMDIEAYAGMYTGRTKVLRLLFIADKCDNETMKLEALRMAYEEIKKGVDTNLHREVSSKIRGCLGTKYTVDHAWVESVEKRALIRREKLENELNGYRVCY
jgi:COP9 signalosome complex subunit 1